MTKTMIDSKMPKSDYAEPVIYVHAKGRSKISQSEAKSLLKTGLPLCSRLAYEGWTQTVNGYDQPAQLVAELARSFPGRPIIFLRAGLQPDRQQIDELLEIARADEQPIALTALSNADETVNPFAGLLIKKQETDQDFESLVKLLAPGEIHTLNRWCEHFLLFSAELVERLAGQQHQGTMMQGILAAGGALKVSDRIFMADSQNRVISPLKLEPHETACPPPFGELSAKIQDWFNAGIEKLPLVPDTGGAATLHITHSWGGGLAEWVKSFIATDAGQQHYQLRSENPQKGRGYGQRISLYAGNELRCPIASWWLNPAILSVTENHDQYREILAEICQRYAIGRVFISSLIGHSLDALRSGLPSLQILHDHFPLWPLLSVNPEPYLRKGESPDIETALKEHKNKLEFRDRNAHEWSQFVTAYTRALEEQHVKIAAPGQTVLDFQTRMSDVFNHLETRIIPHGFPDMGKLKTVLPKPREDGRLRMVILGRMQTGKGAELLARALPELARYVQVYLLGTGKPGEAFFGMPGVDVVLEYKRDELADTLKTIGPHFAALLSVVPETYSFTLSELQKMQIPALATRLGSFPTRIEHNSTGWLIDAEADALVKQVAELCDKPEQIESVRSNLAGIRSKTLKNMLRAYNSLCPASALDADLKLDKPGLWEHRQTALAFEKARLGNSLQEAIQQSAELSEKVEKRTEWALRAEQQLQERTEWALTSEKQRKAAEKNYEKWIDILKQESENLKQELNRLQQLVAEQQANLVIMDSQMQMADKDYQLLEGNYYRLSDKYHQLYEERLRLLAEKDQLYETHQQLESDYRRLQADLQHQVDLNETILASQSWKITRPLRVGRRVMRNLKQARVWNPARWPWLISRLIRNLSTLGVAKTFDRLQATTSQTMPEALPTPMPMPMPQPEITEQVATEAVPGPPAFPAVEQPKASIVIPVYNQWNFTAACLWSLLEFKGKYSFEVIVVDDNSSDSTADQLAQIENITYLRNEENLGFVGSCNRGARHARGEFLVLLNNDTQVTEGWLDELIDTFDQQPKAGMVGSRLIYPDGKLQESGGIIFNDGSGWNYGRDQDAQNPEYHFLREVDYCSGACIALKTDYFHQLGALDERYSPAYYEDTDLAFKVRESGLKVFIQPLSVIIHHEGATSGTDTSTGTKKYQLINQKKFVERWQKELQSQPAPVNDPNKRSEIYFASSHRVKKRILIIDATTPEPDKDSGSVRMTNLMKCCLDMGYGVTFFADNLAYAGKYTKNLQRSGVEVLYHPQIDSLHEFFRSRGSEFDYILISRHYIAINYVPYIKRYCTQARFIFDTVDLHYLREQRLAELEQNNTLRRTANQTKRSELIVIKAADATLVVSTVEQQVLAEDAPGERVFILSNIHQVPGRDKPFAERKDIYFVGGYQHPPNVDAAIWFVKNIWPLIHKKLPDLRFHLIGSKATDEIRALEGNGVIFHGYVESIDPFLNDCRLAVAPLRYGAGVKGKVNMSMAHGQPVVATPAAAEGMFAENERDILIAEDAKSFAREVVRLYQDEALWNRISDASVKNVEKHFSLATAREHLVSLFDSFEG